MVLLTREQLEDRLAALHQASLELGARSFPGNSTGAHRHLARTSGCCLCCPGGGGREGKLVKFITAGMTEKRSAGLAHPPVGRGMIGALSEERRTIRVPSIRDDKRSVGFPNGHPPMDSFLGVPIFLGDRFSARST